MSTTVLDLQSFYPADLRITDVEETSQEIIIHMHSVSRECTCHKCGAPLIKHHGSHHRNVQDLPILGKRVKLDTQIFDYECSNPACDPSAVTETFDGFLTYNSRMTERLEDIICILAVETSCEACARILKSMNVKISGDTVIRLLTKRYMNQPTPICGSTIGIDDFAFKKRHTYGTIIVDEATHDPVAVLDGRDGETLKEWLRQNKHVTAVTRDRASAYAKAVEEILPDCMQIADRFHLHQNLMDAVNKVLGRTVPATIAIPNTHKSIEDKELSTSVKDEGKKIASIVDNLTESEQTRRQLIIEIQGLHKSGASIREIAHITGKERKTVKKYLDGDPDTLCRSNKHSQLESCTDSIIKTSKMG